MSTETPYAGRMIFDLTAEQRAKLERLRASRGLRSCAETLRAMIDGESEGSARRFVDTAELAGDAGSTPARPAPPKATYRKPIGTDKPAFSSRLKGEWKAP